MPKTSSTVATPAAKRAGALKSSGAKATAALLGATLAAFAAAQTGAGAQGVMPPQPQNVVSLSATATVELNMDWLTVVYGTTREGQDAQAVQQQIRQALEAALAEARRVAKPGEVQVRTGGFYMNPRYAPKGGISGWQGSTELVVEGRDTQAIAQLMGRIQTLTISRVNWSLSREAREKVEAEVTGQAIERFKARAQAVSAGFGMAGYNIREVNVSGNEPGPPVMMQAMRGRAAMAAVQDESMPIEAGKAQVTATVSGTVQMK